MVKTGDMMEPTDVIDILSIDLIGVIPEDREILISTNRGMPSTYNHKSEAGQAYKRIAQRLEGEDVPIPEFKSLGLLGTWFGKLFTWG
jgi:septum site-determining protein MinD